MTARIISTAVVAALLLTGTALSAPPAPDTSDAAQTLLTAREAEAAALTHAGLTAEEVTELRSHLDREKTLTEWDVEFRSGDWEYDYDLNAETGAVLRWDRDHEPLPPVTEPPSPPAATEAPTEPPAPPATEAPREDRITAAQAKAIALSHAGLSAGEVAGLQAEFDYDDGRPEYDVEFRCGGYEYEYEIHAGTGSVLSWDKEYDD